MTWKGLLREMDMDELVYHLALDGIEAEERAAVTPRPSTHWIELNSPRAYEQLKHRMGMN